MELEWLKKKLPTLTEAKRALIEPSHPAVSLVRQCELMEINRSTLPLHAPHPHIANKKPPGACPGGEVCDNRSARLPPQVLRRSGSLQLPATFPLQHRRSGTCQ